MPNFEDMAQRTSDFLAHYGVKGMKWGVQKDEVFLRKLTGGEQMRAVGGTKEERKAANQESKAAWKDYKKNTTGKERRADKREAIQAKAEYIINESLKRPDALIKTQGYDGYPIVMTGREVVDRMSRGGALNVPYTEIWA